MGLTEETVCEKSGLSRVTLRTAEQGRGNLTLESLNALASAFDRNLVVLLYPKDSLSEFSVVACSMKVVSDGAGSWKGHYMDLVDEFRRTLDPRLLLLPPVSKLDLKLKALLASIVLDLSSEAKIDPPSWAENNYFLETPWFLSESDSLKASALIESPVFYRKNNIFILENFLKRA